MPKYKKTEFPHLHTTSCEARIASPDELSAYIDKELPAWKRYLIQQHLRECEHCAGHVQSLQKTDKFLRQGGEVEASADFLACVMVRVSAFTQHQQQRESFWYRVVPRLGTFPTRWVRYTSILTDKLRYNIRTRSPVYIFALTFCVFTMVGATLYSTRSVRFGQPVHAWQKSDGQHGEKLISFEVIRPEPPKRLLTTTLQQK